MAKRRLSKRLIDETRVRLRALVLHSKEGKRLQQHLRRKDETDEEYFKRLNLLHFDSDFGTRPYETESSKEQTKRSRQEYFSGPGMGSKLAQESARFVEAELDRIVNNMMTLGEELISAAQNCDARKLQALITKSAPVNYQDPETGATALHYVAGYDARPALRVLLKTGQCDFLIRDNEGRLASELAGTYGHDPAMARLLLAKEKQQARERGITLRRRPAPSQP